MSAKHIALIYTGGTIGMARTDKGYAPMKDFAAVLSKLLHPVSGAMPRYTLHEYATPIDSTNAVPEDWQRIARDIAARYHEHDGFVVLHGTDTMAYTASALSFMLQGLRKPVIVTGSQIPLGEVRSDAAQNLITAMQLAASDQISEVAIYFNQRLLRGNRATKTSASRMQAFDSPNYPWLAEAGIDLRLNASVLLPRAAGEKFETPAYAHGRVLPVRFVPGMPVRLVQAMLDLDPQALILQGYGAGNVPDRDSALFDVLRRAHESGVVLVACSQSLHGEVALGTYATGSMLESAGAIGAMDMTFEAIFAKLHHLFALGMSAQEIRMAFLQDISGELAA
ncbi:type I asparaginase [Noviherbaspirillum cavernae]|uniref:asparaginase n=1 Tax=Noviherbaspirillum cavernae TaxID=2320862 RepID=A0A418WXD8_9BURK|nr:type I asparaginase [Noviherbaspirillum cavernae]RJG04857.1 type I asparaginase [Noviherbaspirillum cavernae]